MFIKSYEHTVRLYHINMINKNNFRHARIQEFSSGGGGGGPGQSDKKKLLQRFFFSPRLI